MRYRGFTIIEVMLFFGISGFLIIGLMVGTSATIARQRYNDSVQDLAEFFRREYAAAINIENGRGDAIDNRACLEAGATSPVGGTNADIEGSHRGRSACLIYGRLITIGESINDATIHSYDLIGRELDLEERSSTTPLPAALVMANINVLVCSDPTNPAAPVRTVGDYRYSPQWLARVETTANPRANLRASILIVRSPINGAIHTLILPRALEVQNAQDSSSCSSGTFGTIFSDVLPSITGSPDPDPMFRAETFDFCVGSDDLFALSERRTNIRILRDGHNGSAVEILEQDNMFDSITNPGGNRCEE